MGNVIDSKLGGSGTSSHYSIIEDAKLASLPSNPSSLWSVKKVNFHNENKHSLLFEFNASKFVASSETNKKVPTRQLKLACNHIKVAAGLDFYSLSLDSFNLVYFKDAKKSTSSQHCQVFLLGGISIDQSHEPQVFANLRVHSVSPVLPVRA
jgi:hypothetical protein